MKFLEKYFKESVNIIQQIDKKTNCQDRGSYWNNETGGSIFFLGVGGREAHASHVMNDFRKICGIFTCSQEFI